MNSSKDGFLLVQSGQIVCALPLRGLSEVCRPLQLVQLAGAPEYVAGVATVRGLPTPVVSLARLMGENHEGEVKRWVLLRAGEHSVALAVERTIGVAPESALAGAQVPPLLSEVRSEVVQSIAALDERLLVTLKSAALVPEGLWERLAVAGEPSA